MLVQLSDLRKVTSMLFDHLESADTNSFEFSEDYYWYISDDQRYDPHIKPSELSLGQLTDDWSELIQILNREKEPLGYAFVWLSAILRRLGEDVVV